MTPFQSVFAERLAGYVLLRRQLGLRFVNQEALLHAFDRYVAERDDRGVLTEALARTFATAVAATSATVPGRRYSVVRQFADYLATFDPRTPRLDPKALYRQWRQPPPYIFTEEELGRLLHRATQFSPRHRTSNRTVHAMIGLAASTGLRPREVLGLDVSDVDLDTGLLTIRRTKLDKDRVVPVHATTRDVLRAYAVDRGQMPGAAGETPFFLNTRGQRVQPENVAHLFGQLVGRIGLPSPRGKRPTFSSLRHTFAVHRLVAWYRAGANVQAHLPVLATYMGHVHYASTAYYLTATAELLGIAADRLGALTPEVTDVQDR
jgi:integrase